MVTKYETKDIIPIIYCVLGYLLIDATEGFLKYTVEKYYPDLKGLLDHDITELDGSTLELLRAQSADPIVYCGWQYIRDLDDVMETFRNIYAFDPKMILNDQRITDLAGDLYEATGDILHEVKSVQESLEDLNNFMWFGGITIHYLRKLVVFEELDFESVFNDKFFDAVFIDRLIVDADDDNPNEIILSELLIRFFEYNWDLMDLTQLENTKANNVRGDKE